MYYVWVFVLTMISFLTFLYGFGYNKGWAMLAGGLGMIAAALLSM